MAEAARGLAPVLAERAREAEELRELPEATLKDLHAAGLFAGVHERGGLLAGFPALTAFTRELAKGCASTAWVTMFYSLHNWLITFLPEQGHAEVRGGRPYALVPAVLAPTGTAEPTAGGYRVTGRWSFATGIMHADWVMVVALVTDPLEPRLFAVPASRAVVHDVWHTSGMRATGSNDVELRDVVVPPHLTISMLDFAGPAPRYPLIPVMSLAAAAVAVGAAEGLLEAFEDRLSARVLAYSGVKQADMSAARVRLAQAAVRLDAAVALFEESVRRLRDEMDLRQRSWHRLTAAHVVKETREIVNDVCAASGATAQFAGSPFQRVQRDLNTLCGHVIFDLDTASDVHARARLGLDLPPTAMA
ncbi:acyl-CoA dehydrogenase [Bailinhaonella thermotolerans]|uniref:Acyl-CoA dehydrogenase n=1 Tax=Bailinhaonella thermotolerans TaxID=1070861 RepID=A0A3A4AST9_9ACTN|nr:acyl-CoA dehydrogenase [Bailinhaonella thermotolerans]